MLVSPNINKLLENYLEKRGPHKKERENLAIF